MTDTTTAGDPTPRPRRPRRGVYRLAVAGGTAVVLAAIVAGAAVGLGRDRTARAAKVAPAAEPTPGGVMMPYEGNTHMIPPAVITYKHYPPTSGSHYYIWAPLGVYPAAKYPHPLPVGYWVHNLEHGAIVIVYHCPQGCPALAKQLGELTHTFPLDKYGQVKMIVTPYDHMQHRIAILAWRWIDQMDSFDRPRLLGFYRKHVNRGPEDIGPDQYITG
jgi:hypothetical protein